MVKKGKGERAGGAHRQVGDPVHLKGSRPACGREGEHVLLYGDLASLLVSMAMFVTQLKSPPIIVEGVVCGVRRSNMGSLSE